MATEVRAAGQITIFDVTDGYSVELSQYSHSMNGGITGLTSAQSIDLVITALCGGSNITANVNKSDCICNPTSVTIGTISTTETGTVVPITFPKNLKQAGTVTIPVVIQHGNDSITITKTFSFSVALPGESVSGVTNYYLATSAGSGVTRNTTGWTTSVQTMTATNQYLWNYEVITGNNGSTLNTTDPVIIGRYGQNGGTGKGISSITEYYLASTQSSGVTTSTSGWTTAVQTTDATKKYLWNYEVIAYTSGNPYTSTPRIIGTYGDKGDKGDQGIQGIQGIQGVQGPKGDTGANALTIVIVPSNGISLHSDTDTTTLTAHVYSASGEITGSALTGLGTIKWYKDNTYLNKTGTSITVNATDITNVAVYSAQLEG